MLTKNKNLKAVLYRDEFAFKDRKNIALSINNPRFPADFQFSSVTQLLYIAVAFFPFAPVIIECKGTVLCKNNNPCFAHIFAQGLKCRQL